MATLTLQGTEIHTNGNLPKVGDSAPDFVLVNSKMEDVSLSTCLLYTSPSPRDS